MAITNTEFLSDKIRVHYCCTQPWGTPDEDGVVEVTYESLRTLPPAPSLNHGLAASRETWEELVYIPTQELTVSFHFAEWEETDDFRMQALVGGPYLREAVR